MTARLKLTPLGVTVLALLRESDMHPYEMLRLLLERRRDRVVPVTKGTLYHTVARLERQELIAEVGVDREGNRPERTTYTLLDRGQAAIVEWVRSELPRVDPHGSFRLALVEAHNLPRAEALALLAARREMLATSHEDYRSTLEDARSRAVPEQYLVDADRQVELLEAELRWLDRTLARFSVPDLPWVGDDSPAPDLRAR
ncbi:PadR family transcriptional regulator [Brachybacterium huguangmaarense]|uniref:PadR family transcriptional regulator n=1 Tax=Brachybacterium huguangmaarense TaxID=1652028 RepID=A0ABY6G059_9MICO|nr:PadR family transcriptional regulator [Brachybacterium huguangmaarense]UYG16589.1 PadR family transcriptional regulator [Brachybacterium huguangmaarense]